MFSGGFVEGLWVCEGFIESLAEAYEGAPPVVLWSGSCVEGLESVCKKVLERFCGEFMVLGR